MINKADIFKGENISVFLTHINSFSSILKTRKRICQFFAFFVILKKKKKRIFLFICLSFTFRFFSFYFFSFLFFSFSAFLFFLNVNLEDRTLPRAQQRGGTSNTSRSRWHSFQYLLSSTHRVSSI